MEEKLIKIDLDSISEFPPSFNKENNTQQNTPFNNTIILNNQQKDEFEEFAENFQKKTLINSTSKIQQENELELNSYLNEINIENNKQVSFKFKNKDFNIIFISYTNLNFIILSENKKIGNLYRAEIEESEFQIDQDEEIEMLPPEYEVKCILGNRFDNLNGFFANFISSNFFNFCQKANKAINEKPKFEYKNPENENCQHKEIDIFEGKKDFYKNENSFFHRAIRNNDSLLISLDLKIENVRNEEKNCSKTFDKIIDLESIKYMDEFEIANITNEFNNLLRENILNILH